MPRAGDATALASFLEGAPTSTEPAPRLANDALRHLLRLLDVDPTARLR